ncbi:hypothetical protein CARUB_v10003032mg [Capsella rubella]|uniref:Phorbol-ester/DAG-type domain-containing protein n=1 Tax=Capsella rubella TaxID=81985 RepID=R0FJ14_9BRAS|nr:uncharacterized protein LOC17883421 [Capsella rubella]EOA22397.1 hypothetical protein CARUB_v10003032mg [Capsella rubella]
MKNPLGQAPSRRLLCPRERVEKDKDGKVTTISGQIHHIINSSYIISDAEDERSNHLHSLLLCNQKEGGEDNILHCWVCRVRIKDNTYYFCSYCKDDYHDECVRSPSVFHCSDHPKHPLQLLWFPGSLQEHQRKCCSCISARGNMFYYCSICDFMIHHACARNPTPLTIDNPKRHKHTLHYFPRKSGLVCDVCALVDDSSYLYICLPCDFAVHKRCVHLPYVIKVSRHGHRLTFTPKLIFKELTKTDCGVCHAKINENYGAYRCKVGCVYTVHSRCAMQSDVCDGVELEGEPEETYENINTKMFELIRGGIMQHLTHPGHELRIEQKFHDESKHCQACRLTTYDECDVYRCLQCEDFILHKSCAYMPRIKQFMLHVHPLFLEHMYTTDWFRCRKCHRYSCGFAYACGRRGWCHSHFSWILDTLCASICEPFNHHSHPHPLFITCGEDESKICSICQSAERQPLNCVKCDFVLCFHCATLPHKARYAHDEHLLIFSYEEDGNYEFYMCEICEEDVNPKNGLYACSECEVRLHIECLLGKDPYITPGSYLGGITNVLPNTCSTRPICKTCKRRCLYKIKIKSSTRGGPFCSVDCYERW